MSAETAHPRLPANVVLLMFRAKMQPAQIVHAITGRSASDENYAADVAWVERLLRTAYPQSFPHQEGQIHLTAE
ncbi:MAG: hypothetical protein H7Z42_17670 [Roseiflexaceae bacterium]|nr:hypothetical protein [Roseiflexaceae bacterium]